jgi:hypothetical protein
LYILTYDNGEVVVDITEEEILGLNGLKNNTLVEFITDKGQTLFILRKDIKSFSQVSERGK